MLGSVHGRSGGARWELDGRAGAVPVAAGPPVPPPPQAPTTRVPVAATQPRRNVLRVGLPGHSPSWNMGRPSWTTSKASAFERFGNALLLTRNHIDQFRNCQTSLPRFEATTN